MQPSSQMSVPGNPSPGALAIVHQPMLIAASRYRAAVRKGNLGYDQ